MYFTTIRIVFYLLVVKLILLLTNRWNESSSQIIQKYLFGNDIDFTYYILIKSCNYLAGI